MRNMKKRLGGAILAAAIAAILSTAVVDDAGVPFDPLGMMSPVVEAQSSGAARPPTSTVPGDGKGHLDQECDHPLIPNRIEHSAPWGNWASTPTTAGASTPSSGPAGRNCPVTRGSSEVPARRGSSSRRSPSTTTTTVTACRRQPRTTPAGTRLIAGAATTT